MSEQRKFGLTPSPARSSTSSVSGSSRSRGGVSSKASEWDNPSPDRRGSAAAVGGTVDDDDLGVEEQEGDDDDDDGEVRQLGTMPLMKFVQTHTSEDNAAFNELLAKDQELHKRKYNWAFEGDKAEKEGQQRLLLLSSGAAMTQRLLEAMDAACADKEKRGNDRPNGPETWPHRAKNPLLFPPDLNTNREICGLPAGDGRSLATGVEGDIKLLTDGEVSQSTSSTATRALISGSSGSRVGVIPKAPPATVAKNTRFRGDEMPSGSAAPSPVSFGSVLDGASVRSGTDLQRMVEMTPSPMPGAIGAGGASPFVTWGDIEGTPMILDPSSTPLGPLASAISRDSGGPQFRMEATSYRETLAANLNQELTAKKKRRQEATTANTTRGGRANGRRGSGMLTPSERLAGMSPAAQSLAMRLTGNRFPLKSSKANGSGRRAGVAGGISSARSVASNVPTPSPFAVGRLRDDRGSAGLSSAGGVAAARRREGSALTDNLLPPRP